MKICFPLISGYKESNVKQETVMNTLNDDLNSDLYAAVVAGNIEAVGASIEAGADVNKPNKDGLSPLSLAAINGKLEAVSTLIKAGAEVNPLDDNRAWLPLCTAAKGGHQEVVHALIEAGAHVNQSSNGTTALCIAAANGKLEAVSTLIEAEADVNQIDTQGLTPLLVAAGYGHLEVVTALIEVSADLNQSNNEGETPLLLAAKMEHTDIMEYFFSIGIDYESARAYAEKKGLKECELKLRQSWHIFISQSLEANADYQDRYRKIESLISKCPVMLEPLYNPLVLVPSGYSIEESSWRSIESVAMASNTAPLCPQTRKVITSACPNYTLKEANEKLWMEIEALYQEMIRSAPLADASMFQSEPKPRGAGGEAPGKIRRLGKQ